MQYSEREHVTSTTSWKSFISTKSHGPGIRYEAADRNAKSLKGSESAIHRVHKQRTTPNPTTNRSSPSWVTTTPTPCHQCGRSNHDKKDCHNQESVCHFCKKKGHIASVCRAKKGQPKKGSFQSSTQRAQYMETIESQDTPSQGTEKEDLVDSAFLIAHLDELPSHPFRTNIEVDGNY